VRFAIALVYFGVTWWQGNRLPPAPIFLPALPDGETCLVCHQKIDDCRSDVPAAMDEFDELLAVDVLQFERRLRKRPRKMASAAAVPTSVLPPDVPHWHCDRGPIVSLAWHPTRPVLALALTDDTVFFYDTMEDEMLPVRLVSRQQQKFVSQMEVSFIEQAYHLSH
jgi:hypothetical protein